MIEGKRIFAVIPARGGSKRVPGKNILQFCGKPLIAWSIDAGRQSKYIDRLIVSTDDEKIAAVSKEYGAEVPFLRPSHLATDEATSIGALIHAVNYVKGTGEEYDYLVVLQPTSPLRTAENIDQALEKIIKKAAKGIISVCPVSHPVEWTNVLPENDSMENFISKEYMGKRSQEFPMRYQTNGAIYIVEIKQFLKQKELFFKENLIAYRMEIEQSIDIDTALDFKMAEYILKKRDE